MKLLRGGEAAQAVASLADRYASFDPAVEKTVAAIVNKVRSGGDAALLEYACQFDGLAEGAPMRVPARELKAAIGMVSAEFIRAIETAAKNIRNFAEWQLPRPWMRTIHPGLRVGQAVRPLESVGCYAPGGRYPLPSTVLMTVIPAQVAGVQRIAVASPRPAAETLAAAALIGVTEFYRIGGAQAVAAFAYGTESIPKVNKIVGPAIPTSRWRKSWWRLIAASIFWPGRPRSSIVQPRAIRSLLPATWWRRPSTTRRHSPSL